MFRIKTNFPLPKMSTIYSKNSFDRFGDDLCEYVLSFIEFKDSFRLSCVSKQWKRLIFNKQKHLLIDNSFKIYFLEKLKIVFKNCLNIRSIGFSSDIIEAYKTYIFNYIISNTNINLNEIECDFELLTEDMFKEFCQMFGHNLKTIYFKGYCILNEDISMLCPNVTDLKTYSLKNIFNGNTLLFNNLKSIAFDYRSDDKQRFDLLIDSNRDCLQSIEVHLFYDIGINELNSLTKLSELKCLSIRLHLRSIGCEETNIILLLKELSNNCKVLKKINFDICLTPDRQVISEIFQTFNNFRELKILSIIAYNIVNNSIITSKQLNNCKNLTHLSLNLSGSHNLITDSFMDSIDKHLPKLQSIKFNCEKYITDWSAIGFTHLTEFAFYSLSKLKYIQTIHFNSNIYELQSKEHIIKDLMKNCRKIKSIITIFIDNTGNRFKEIDLTDKDLFGNNIICNTNE